MVSEILTSELCSELVPNPNETMSWGDWKVGFNEFGVNIKNDDAAPYTDDKIVSGAEALSALKLCDFEIIEKEVKNSDGEAVDEFVQTIPDKPKMNIPAPAKIQGPRIVAQEPAPAPSVYRDNPSPELKEQITAWREAFQGYFNRPPQPGDVLTTDDGSDVRLDIEFYPEKPPFIYTRVFVPMVVLGPVGWFAQRQDQHGTYGIKCIMIPKCRDEIIKRKGLGNNSILVKSIKVIKEASNGRSLLCEVYEW